MICQAYAQTPASQKLLAEHSKVSKAFEALNAADNLTEEQAGSLAQLVKTQRPIDLLGAQVSIAHLMTRPVAAGQDLPALKAELLNDLEGLQNLSLPTEWTNVLHQGHVLK